MGSISVRSRENGLERSSGDVQTGDGSSALLSSQLGDKMEKICIYLHFVYKFGDSDVEC